MSKIRLLLAYDGTDFRGFALNLGVRTVAGELTGALQRILNQDITLACAGRTDAGVHAWGQVVSFEVDLASRKKPLDLGELQASLNKICAPEMAVREAAWAPEDFDARHSAKSRTYQYRILRLDSPDPFRARYVWHLPGELDVDAMNQAAHHILGEHDFSSFCRRAGEASLVRRVDMAFWDSTARQSETARQGETAHQGESARQGEITLKITASAFCHQMVRSLVGTFVEIGLGRRPPEEMVQILSAKDRQTAGNLAPPQGLCLLNVDYK